MEKINFHSFSEIDLDNYLDQMIEIDLFYFKDEAWDKSAFKYELPDKKEKSFIMLLNDQLVGYCVLSRKEGSFHLHKIAVRNNAIQKGLGSKMLDYILEELKVDKLTLKVNVNNIFAINFYFKHHFSIKEVKNEYYTMILE